MAIIPALGHLKDERAVPLLIKALNNRDEDWLGREAAALALGDISATKAYQVLSKPPGCRKPRKDYSYSFLRSGRNK